MKVNLRKYQTGGPFVVARPVSYSSTLQQPTGQQSTTKSETTSIVDDETNDLMKEGGLTSDYYVLLESLTNLENDPLSFIDSNKSGKAVRMMRGKINEMINNKEIWKESVSEARKKGSYNEVAVGTNGEVFYKGEDGSIKTTSVSQHIKEKKKQDLLTIGDLLNERQGNRDLAFNDNIFSISDNSVGMKQITDHVLSLFDTLSDFSTKTEKHYTKDDIREQFSLDSQIMQQGGKKLTAQEKKSMKSLVDKMNTPGEFIKEELKTSGKGKDLNVALNYIWKTLGEEAQQKLNVVARLQGDTSLNLLGGMLENYSATSTESVISPEKESQVRDIDKSGTSGMRATSTFEIDHIGQTGKEMLTINDPATGKKINAIATSQFRLTDEGGTPYGVTSVDNIFKTKVGTLLETDKATFGGNLIDMSNAKDVLYDGQQAQRVYLPVKPDGTADLDLMESIKEAEARVFSNPDLTAAQINETFRQMGLDAYIQVDGNKQYVMNDRFKPFMVMYGYAGDKSNVTNNNPKMKALDSSEKSNVLNYLKPIYEKEGIDPTGWMFNRGLYKAMIAIPYTDNSSIHATAIGNNLMIPAPTLQNARINKQISQGAAINADPSQFFNNN